MEASPSRPAARDLAAPRVLASLFDEAVEAVGKAFDIEIQRIVVTVGNVGVEGGVKGRDEPTAGAHAGDRVKQRQPIVLRGGKRGIGRRAHRCARAAARCAAAESARCAEKPFSAPAKFAACSNLVSRQAYASSWLSSIPPTRLTTTWALPQSVRAFEMGEIVDAWSRHRCRPETSGVRNSVRWCRG